MCLVATGAAATAFGGDFLLDGEAEPARGDVAAPEGGEQLVQFVEAQALRDFFLVDGGNTQALQFSIQQDPALRDAVIQVLRLEPVAHLGARTRAFQVALLRR